MATPLFSPDVLKRLQAIADHEQRSPDEVLKSLLDSYPLNEPDEDYYQPDRVRRRMYDQARRYWSENGNNPKASLTDEQLDEQFWLFDQEGIPRLKSEQDQVAVADNDLFATVLKLSDQYQFQSGETDTADHFDEYVSQAIQHPADDSEGDQG